MNKVENKNAFDDQMWEKMLYVVTFKTFFATRSKEKKLFPNL